LGVLPIVLRKKVWNMQPLTWSNSQGGTGLGAKVVQECQRCRITKIGSHVNMSTSLPQLKSPHAQLSGRECALRAQERGSAHL
jgi:hypothetical protein